MAHFEEIYQAYFGDVYRYLLKQTHGDRPLAEDLTSETFFKALKNLDSYNGQAKLSVWLIQIAKNSYLDYLKKSATRQEIATIDLPEPPQTVNAETLLARKESSQQLYQLLHQLPEPYKEIFMLRHFGELSFKEIGSLFDKDQNWACVSYHRARKKIKQGMEASS